MKSEKLSVALINPQGHVRWNNPPIAGHPDTGGQIVYILELAKELARLGCRVDIFTRYFDDPEWPGYTEHIEEYPGDSRLRIIRIKCGPERFLEKEALWPHLREYTDGVKEFYSKEGGLPDIMSSHYADAGVSAAMLKEETGLLFTHTGHSLGGKKMDNLNITRQNFELINRKFRFHMRIASERVAFRNSSAIPASTEEEVSEQYGHRVYSGAIDNPEKFRIIPPGISPAQFYAFHRQESDRKVYDEVAARLEGELKKKISPERLSLPCVFSAARFDAKKNPTGLLKAYASSSRLRENSNLLIIAGSVEDPLEPSSRDAFKRHEWVIIEDIKEIIKENSLEGNVCFAPGFGFSHMPCVYRYAGRHKWIFVNPALHEPFGLTIVEAMASGVPVVATCHGGPSEILEDGRHGVLADSTSCGSLREGIEKLLDESLWDEFSEKGLKRVRERFTWGAAAKSYLELFEEIISNGSDSGKDFPVPDYFSGSGSSGDSDILEELRKLYFG